MSARRTCLAACMTLLLLVASGCSGGSSAPATPAPSMPSPTPTGPRFAKTVDGASKFARAYFDAYNTALATGNPEKLASFRDPQCAYCKEMERFIVRSFARGRVEGATIKVLHVAAPGFKGDEVTVTTIVDRTAGRVLSMDGSTIQSIPRRHLDDYEVSVRWSPAGWSITAISIFKT